MNVQKETLDVPSNNHSCLELQLERLDVPSDNQSGAVNFLLGLPSDKGVAVDLESIQDYAE